MLLCTHIVLLYQGDDVAPDNVTHITVRITTRDDSSTLAIATIRVIVLAQRYIPSIGVEVVAMFATSARTRAAMHTGPAVEAATSWQVV